MAEPKIEYKFDIELIKNIKGFINSNASVKVGILADAPHESEEKEGEDGEDKKKSEPIGILKLAATHEFGSKKRNIPPRSFLRTTFTNRMDDFDAEMEAGKIRTGKKIADGKEKEVLNQIGAWWVTAVHDTFDAQGPGWQKLSDAYEKEKAKKYPSPKILMSTNALRNSITYEVGE